MATESSEPTSASRFQYRPYRPDDEPAVLGLHRRVFGSHGTHGATISSRHWRWKYAPNGKRSASLVALDRSVDHAVVGFVGGVRLPCWHPKHDVRAIHTLDHMVDPSYRRGLRKNSVFSRLVNRWVDAYCGPDRRGLGFGFPCLADYRIGERVAQYDQLMPVTCLVLDQFTHLSALDPRFQGEMLARIPDDAEQLWERCRVRYPMMIARTLNLLRWRYEQHPDIRYHFAALREDGRLQGLAVLRQGGVAPDAMTVMDWLTPPDAEAAAASLLSICQRSAHEAGRGVLVVWVPASSPHRAELVALGWQPRPGPWLVAGRVWDARLTPQEVRVGLILSFGDMDFL